MIDLYYWPTPNGWKISIMLEECGLPYEMKPVAIGKGEQFKPEFLELSPNNRIPAIVDHAPADGGPPFSVFETGAILIYLAEKTGRFLPADIRGRSRVVQWVMWQMSGLGPMLGQHGHFALYASEKIPYAIERYRDEARIMGVIEQASRYDEYVTAVRAATQKHFADRAERSIRRLQKLDLVDRSLDPAIAATALGAMVARFDELWLVQGYADYDFDEAVEQLTTLWCNALRLEEPRPVRR